MGRQKTAKIVQIRGETMTTRGQRRRERRCPSCGGSSIRRGGEVEGVAVHLVPPTEMSMAITVPAYSDICNDCGLVMLFVRRSGGGSV